MRPKVSVIIPVYNAGKYLEECLNSVCAQTLKEIEIICVDDGSTDNSMEILHSFADRDERLIIFNEKNSGAGAARNRGLEIAKGEYLSFLDADDFFEQTMLEKAYNSCIENSADVTVFRSDEYYTKTKQYKPRMWSIRTNLLPSTIPFSANDVEKDIFHLFVWWPWDKLFSSDLIRKNNLKFQVQRTTNDMFFVVFAVLLANKIMIVDDVLAHYRRDNNQSLSVTRENSWYCFADAFILVRSKLKELSIFERYEQDFINYVMKFSVWNSKNMAGESKKKLHNAIAFAWNEQLGVAGHTADFFYDKDSYNYYLELIKSATAATNIVDKNKQIDSEAIAIRASASYRIGRFITFIPRKIRGGIRCYNEHGMRYTMHRIKEKFRNLFRKKTHVK